MAGRQGHLPNEGHVPGADDVTAAVRVVFQPLHQARDLIHRLRAGSALPAPPLGTVDGAEVAVLIGPLIPDGDFVFLEIAHVGVALEKPEQLVDDAAQVQFLGGDQGEAPAEVVAALLAENGPRACAGAVLAEGAVVEDFAQEAVVLVHLVWVDGYAA